jgi:hypothetical protein
MRLAVITDPHLEFLNSSGETTVKRLAKEIAAADRCLILGDIDSQRNPKPWLRKQLLSAHPQTNWILGNHDLWGRFPLPPPEVFGIVTKDYAEDGHPLETSWTKGVVVSDRGVAIVGSMGFPDFQHPWIVDNFSYLDSHSATNDSRFIDLSDGWVKYTRKMMQAFKQRLKKALSLEQPHTIVATHYPILTQQSKLSKKDNGIWPYFFNWTMGQEVLKQAPKYKTKILCLAGHSHEYCAGHLQKAADNVWALGIPATYGFPEAHLIDTTDDGFKVLPPASFQQGLDDVAAGRVVDLDVALNEEPPSED